MGDGVDHRAVNKALLRDRVARDFDAGHSFMEDQAGHLFPGFLGRLLNPIAKSLWHHIGEAEVRKRVLAYVQVVFDAVDAVDDVGLEAAVAGGLPHALALEELVHRGNRDHPAFPRIEAGLQEGFRERVAIAHRFVTEGRGTTFEAAVSSAFPDRAELDAALDHQFRLGDALTAVVKEDPHVLRFPAPLVRHLLHLITETMVWVEAKLHDELDTVYRPR